MHRAVGAVHKKIRIAIGAILLAPTLFIASVATAGPVDDLKAGPSTAVVRGPIGPVMTTPTGAVKFEFTLGLAGGPEGGKGMLDKHGIKDPVLDVRDRFIAGLETKHGISGVRVHQGYLDKAAAKPENLKNTVGDGMALRFETGNWTIIYFMGNWKRYHSQYIGEARLVRTSDGDTIWKGVCVVKEGDKKTAPSADEVRDNTNDVLKNWALNIGPKCSEQLLEKFAKAAS
jgi:hypothetical protein